jgi:hypothetical protein
MKTLLVIAVGCLMLCGTAVAVPHVWGTSVAEADFSGLLSYDDLEIVISAGLDGGEDDITLAWLITHADGGGYDYQYTWTAPGWNPANSHTIIEVTDFAELTNEQEAELYEGPYEGSVKDFTAENDLALAAIFADTGLNPGLHGLKFEDETLGFGEEFVQWTFWSENAPVWGNFVMKAGKIEWAANKGFLDPSTGIFVARPNGEHQVPDTGSTIALLGLAIGLIGFAGRRLRG